MYAVALGPDASCDEGTVHVKKPWVVGAFILS